MRFSLLFLFATLAADPFGKDADLVNPPCPPPSNAYRTLPEALIRFHQVVISPADGPRSHFIPSSSQYTLDAMRRYGFFTGFLLGCDRLQRENNDDWVYPKTRDPQGHLIKYDPVR